METIAYQEFKGIVENMLSLPKRILVFQQFQLPSVLGKALHNIIKEAEGAHIINVPQIILFLFFK